MKLTLQIELDIELIDDDLGDPVPGDPLAERMLDSAEEAIRNQLDDGYANGFIHDMESITTITIDKIQRIPVPVKLPPQES